MDDDTFSIRLNEEFTDDSGEVLPAGHELFTCSDMTEAYMLAEMWSEMLGGVRLLMVSVKEKAQENLGFESSDLKA